MVRVLAPKKMYTALNSIITAVCLYYGEHIPADQF